MYDDLSVLSQAIFSYLNQITILVFSNSIITIFVALWAVRKVAKLLNIIH